jgi:hypothetical protein
MVEIHKLSSAITKQSLRKNELIFEVFKLFFLHDTILYFSEGSQKIMAQISNHKPVNTNNGSPFFLIRAAMPRLRARTQLLKKSYNIGKSTNTSIPGKRNRTTLSTSLESREYESPLPKT